MDFSLLFSSRRLRGLAPPKFPQTRTNGPASALHSTIQQEQIYQWTVNCSFSLFCTHHCFAWSHPQRCKQFCCTFFLAIRRYFKREPSNVSKPERDPNFKEFINKNDLDGSTALHLAVQTGRKEVSQVLIQYGADVNCQNKSLQTPVYLAAVGGHQDVLRMLISQGGDVNAKDSQEKTALHR